MDYERIASELVRALRGRRSQTAFARRLGYRSNVVYAWESGRAYPTAAQLLRVAARARVDVRGAIARFYRRTPPWLTPDLDPATPQAVALLLDDLRGRTPVVAIAQAAGKSRFRVARWLEGVTQPRLPDFLRMIEATSLRMLDFVAALVDPQQLPSLADGWRKLEAARAATYQVPWSQAVLRVLELSEYAALPRHERGWIARRLGISVRDEQRCLALLVESQQVRVQHGKYVPVEVRTLDTRPDRDAALRLRAFWARVGVERLEAGAQGLFAHNVFAVSEADLQRIRELQSAYYRELRAIVARSSPVERVVLANLQLVPLA